MQKIFKKKQQTHRAYPLPLEEGPWKHSFQLGCWDLGYAPRRYVQILASK